MSLEATNELCNVPMGEYSPGVRISVPTCLEKCVLVDDVLVLIWNSPDKLPSQHGIAR